MAVLLFTAPGDAHARVIDRVAAVVGGRVIFVSEVKERAKPFLQLVADKDALARARAEAKTLHDVCDQMIDEWLVEEEAERTTVAVTPAQVDAGIETVAKLHGLTVSGVIALARDQGFDEHAYRNAVRMQLLQNLLINQRHIDLANEKVALEKLHQDLRAHVWVEMRLGSP